VRAIYAAILLLLFSLPVAAAPSADLWERWTAHDDANKAVIDHGAWDEFLGKYVRPSPDGINRVAYGSVTPADKSRLAEYLSKMERVGISKFSRAEQRAYWINLYNATTLKTVLDYYPVKSIRKINISPGLFESGPWGAKLLKVEGEELSLNDIEHRILRPIWKDPRTHYAVNCASLGCPNLAPRAYTAVLMEGLLDDGARAYINHPRGVEIKDGLPYVSSIYRWFRSDFGAGDAGVIAHLLQYARPELADELRDRKDIIGDRYDWSLNDAS
jgi:hypothetical protein